MLGITPDQNLAYFDYSPLRYDWSIFEAIIYTSSFKQLQQYNIVCAQCRALQFNLLKYLLNYLSNDIYIVLKLVQRKGQTTSKG